MNPNIEPLTQTELALVQAYRALSPRQQERLWYGIDHPTDTEYMVAAFAGLCALGLVALVVGTLPFVRLFFRPGILG
jgi:hypothetical protein